VVALQNAHRSEEVRKNHSQATKGFHAALSKDQKQAFRDNLKATWAKPGNREKILELSKIGLKKAMSPEGIKNRNLANLRPEVIEKRRKNAVNRLLKQPVVSGLNIKFGAALHQAGLCPEAEYPVYPYVVDFCFPEKRLIVEVDGDYWHGNPSLYTEFDRIQTKTRHKDKSENTFCKNQGWILLRFWETDINKNIHTCIKRVSEVLNG
jgi:very-short-patch-repair endonuclease